MPHRIMDVTTTTPGLRERKRLALRNHIRHTALELFNTHGYDQVTVEQIADTAEISPMTFYRHFGTKEAVVIGMTATPEFEQLASAVFASNLEPLDTPELRTLTSELINQMSGDWAETMSQRSLLIKNTPALTEAIWQRSSIWTEILSARSGYKTLRARVQLRAIVGAAIEALLAWPDRNGFPTRQSLKDCLSEAIDALTCSTGADIEEGDQPARAT